MPQSQPGYGAGIASKIANGLFLLYYGRYFLQGTGLFFENIHLLPESLKHGDRVEMLTISLMSLHALGLYGLFIIVFFMLIGGERRANYVAVIYLIWKVIGIFVYTLPLVNFDDWVKSFLAIISHAIIWGLLVDGAFLLFYVKRIVNAKRSGDEKNRRMIQQF